MKQMKLTVKIVYTLPGKAIHVIVHRKLYKETV